MKEVLLWRLPAPAVLLYGTEHDMVVSMVLWGLEVASQVWQVLLQYLQIIVPNIGAGFSHVMDEVLV